MYANVFPVCESSKWNYYELRKNDAFASKLKTTVQADVVVRTVVAGTGVVLPYYIVSRTADG